MKTFIDFLTEEKDELGHGSDKLKHIHHPEDRPLLHGKKGFEHTVGALTQAHEHIKSGKKDSGLTMKYDGSPSIVFGHHPKTGKFFVATKSAFNKNPKINHTVDDIKLHHGDKPELAAKLHHALVHLPKVTPKKGVYQGDLMFSHGDVVHNPEGSASFKPNTITYTAHGQEANKIKGAKVGVVVHQQYHGNNIEDMKVSSNIEHKFRQNDDVWHKTAEHDTSTTNYSKLAQLQFQKHIDAAKKIHDEHGKMMYALTEPHQGEGNHMATYINHTVRKSEKPTARGLQQHILDKAKAAASKLKTIKAANAKHEEAKEHVNHIQKNRDYYDNLFKMHQHIAKAKDILVGTLNQNPGSLSHHIDSQETNPEGFVVNHKGAPTKLVNRQEFSRANLLKDKR